MIPTFKKAAVTVNFLCLNWSLRCEGLHLPILNVDQKVLPHHIPVTPVTSNSNNKQLYNNYFNVITLCKSIRVFVYLSTVIELLPKQNFSGISDEKDVKVN